MKPQIIISASLLTLGLFFSGNSSLAARKEQKEIKNEKPDFKMKSMNPGAKAVDVNLGSKKNNNPSKPAQKENQKDSIPHNESNKKVHSEEDGKHHHFHLHRAKRVKHQIKLICFLAKLLLVIAHICLLVFVFYASLAH